MFEGVWEIIMFILHIWNCPPPHTHMLCIFDKSLLWLLYNKNHKEQNSNIKDREFTENTDYIWYDLKSLWVSICLEKCLEKECPWEQS